MLYRDLETQHLHTLIFQPFVIHHLGFIFSYFFLKICVPLWDTFKRYVYITRASVLDYFFFLLLSFVLRFVSRVWTLLHDINYCILFTEIWHSLVFTINKREGTEILGKYCKKNSDLLKLSCWVFYPHKTDFKWDKS